MQAAFFDLDGTLVDLRAVYVQAHQHAAREVLAVELEEHYRREREGLAGRFRECAACCAASVTEDELERRLAEISR